MIKNLSNKIASGLRNIKLSGVVAPDYLIYIGILDDTIPSLICGIPVLFTRNFVWQPCGSDCYFVPAWIDSIEIVIGRVQSACYDFARGYNDAPDF